MAKKYVRKTTIYRTPKISKKELELLDEHTRASRRREQLAKAKMRFRIRRGGVSSKKALISQKEATILALEEKISILES